MYRASTREGQRALALLRQFLDPNQQETLDLLGHFDHGDYRFTLRASGVEVSKVSDGRSLCIRAREDSTGWVVPAPDQALALYLVLRYEPIAFRSTVNRDRVWPTRYSF